MFAVTRRLGALMGHALAISRRRSSLLCSKLVPGCATQSGLVPGYGRAILYEVW